MEVSLDLEHRHAGGPQREALTHSLDVGRGPCCRADQTCVPGRRVPPSDRGWSHPAKILLQCLD